MSSEKVSSDERDESNSEKTLKLEDLSSLEKSDPSSLSASKEDNAKKENMVKRPSSPKKRQLDYDSTKGKKTSSKAKGEKASLSQILLSKIRYAWALFLGKTKKQKRKNKPSYVGWAMTPLFVIFILYSFILFGFMNENLASNPLLHTIMLYLTLNNPYYFGMAITLTYLDLSLLFSNEKILKGVFESHSKVKQVGLFLGLTLVNFYVSYLVSPYMDQYSALLLLATLWLLFQGIRLYSASRNFASRLEAKWTEHYSEVRYLFAFITPFVILGFLTGIAWTFRYYVVIFTLDILARYSPFNALTIYILEMQVIMPMIYIGLILVFTFIIGQLVLSRKFSQTTRAAVFDTLSFALITLVMFFYALYNITLYLFMNPSMLEAISIAMGSNSQSSLMFFIEFIITIIFLLWIILDLKNVFKKGFLFFTTDGLVMLIIATIMAQTTSRVGLITGRAGEISKLASIITYDYVVLPFFIIIFLGITIVFYWIKPQEASMFMHLSSAVIDEEDRSMDTILKFLKREFIRRGEKYLLDDGLIEQIMEITSLPKSVIWSLIYRLNDRFIDLQLLESYTEGNKKEIYVDFIPITQRYQKDKEAEARAQQYMRKSFTENLFKPQRKRVRYYRKKISSSKQSDLFVQALGIQYARKVKEELRKKEEKDKEQLVIDAVIDEATKDLIYEIIKREYIRRISDPDEYEDFRFLISDIASKVEKATRVSAGRLFPLLHEMAASNWNLNLSNLVEDEDQRQSIDDRLIEFLPIDDFDIYYALEKYRPESTAEIRRLMQTWFERNIFATIHREKMENLPPLEYEDSDKEFERTYRSRWFAQASRYFAKHFKDYKDMIFPFSRYSILLESIRLIKKGKGLEDDSLPPSSK